MKTQKTVLYTNFRASALLQVQFYLKKRKNLVFTRFYRGNDVINLVARQQKLRGAKGNNIIFDHTFK